ncbi:MULTISPECIES: LuxR C-terminal-related transcriptional regulator [unclassified Serratia (in: enterobacteria)]|uniref:LuxR C-terminal-related transcriptional regulator n=1 Tax=unclassified Serratia (in: enterobacteria) TaxID=2647522 RepID=UPI002ED12EFA|nr:LuxR C-terminal-related transcriptional regulator [Serratia sp. C2(2)]MEE4449843.1 LuxR C-terminal-related transcriptional regulator [Serratia sp. C2(1)]
MKEITSASSPGMKIEEKKVLIFDSCQYSTLGLTLLCERHSNWHITGVAHSFPKLMKLLALGRADMLLCGIGALQSEFPRLLNLPDYTRGRCILLIDKNSGVLRNTFLAAGYTAVIGKNADLEVLDNLLFYNMHMPHSTMKGDDAGIYLPQERAVLGALLSGKRPLDIATDMGITYRDVSRHKHNGLRRAGVRSINEIITKK